MDFLQETLANYAPDYALPILRTLHQAEPYTRPLRSFYSSFRAYILPLALPYLNTAASLAHSSPAIVSVGALLLFLVIAIQILAFFRRVMMFGVRIVTRLVFWGCIGLVVSVVAQRGVGRTAGEVMEWAGEVGGVWWREYRRWDGQAQAGGGGNGGSKWR